MTNPNSISPAQLNLLLKMAGRQLHVDPNTLRQQLERGDFSSICANLGSDMGNQINQVLSDPQKMQQLLSQTNLQELLKNLNA